MKIEAIDLFCGIGGLTVGLRKAKIKVLAGLDNDKTCEYIYKKNNKCKFILTDIAKYDFREMKKIYSDGSIRVLVGCAPCQPFSSHTFKDKAKAKDNRWNLIDYFLQAVKVLDPHIVSMENVRGLTQTDVFISFVKKIKQWGYQVDYKIVYCPDYGIPQNRSRLVLLASKLGELCIPPRTHSKDRYVTVQEVIKKLPKLNPGEINQNDPVHRAKHLEEINLKRISQSIPHRTWRDWDKSLLPDCYKKASGKTYSGVYGRMGWDGVAPTITTQFTNYGSGRFGHPEQNRALSLREGAMLQTFPEDYDFGVDVNMTKTGRHIGNAVPPQLGYVVGKAIQEHIKAQLKYS